MTSRVDYLQKLGLINPPSFLPSNIHYETIVGSYAYGTSDSMSDEDIYGFCIPPLEYIFPHLAGEIPGFGTKKRVFEQYQEHHIHANKKEYDLTIYSIVKFFQLCMENNPNMVDALFTPLNCVLHITNIGQMVRDNREIFLHKGSFHKFRGYAYSQLSNIENKKRENSNRKEIIEKYGYDVKAAYHLFRLLLECEQILETGTLNLQRDSALLRYVRDGNMSLNEVRKTFSDGEARLLRLYETSKLPMYPRETKIKELLLNCIEVHYGTVHKSLLIESSQNETLKKIIEIANASLTE